MSQALLISNNDTVNYMYEVNLRAYVAMNVTVKQSIAQALPLLEQSPNLDAIICFADLLSDSENLDKIEKILSASNAETPVLIVGDKEFKLENSITIKNKYNIKMLLQTMAKILEITAKDMASLKVGSYFPVPAQLIKRLKESPCAIYLRKKKENLEYDYPLIIEKNTPAANIIDTHIENGVEHVYIESTERLRFINLVSKLVIDELDRKDLSSSEKLEIASQGMKIISDEVFEDPQVTEELVNISKKCIESIKVVAKKAKGIKDLLKMLIQNQSDYCYQHSILCSYIATEIIDKMSWGSEEQKDKVSFALFFHDIYLVPLYKKYTNVNSEEDLLFMDEVTDEDKEIVLNHAKMAGDLIKTFPRCPIGADVILTQHHGMTSGQGFAINFKDDISPLAKVIIIAEELTNIILKKVESGAKLNMDKTILAAQLADKFRGHSYKKIVLAIKDTKI